MSLVAEIRRRIDAIDELTVHLVETPRAGDELIGLLLAERATLVYHLVAPSMASALDACAVETLFATTVDAMIEMLRLAPPVGAVHYHLNMMQSLDFIETRARRDGSVALADLASRVRIQLSVLADVGRVSAADDYAAFMVGVEQRITMEKQ